MEAYVQGRGHVDLGQRLGINTCESLAIGGSANARIIRTTLKDSYRAVVPTLYIIGLTFVGRNELPVMRRLASNDFAEDFEGRWTNPQNQKQQQRWDHFWSEKDTQTYVDLIRKTEVYSLVDRLEDLMYRTITMVSDLKSRGHMAVVFEQCEEQVSMNIYGPNRNQTVLASPDLALLQRIPEIVHGLSWLAVPWQHEQGVPVLDNTVRPEAYNAPPCPPQLKHRKPGEHHKLNEFLANYIIENRLLDVQM